MTNLTEVAGRRVNEREMTTAERAAVNLFRRGADIDKIKQVPVERPVPGGSPGKRAGTEVRRVRAREDGLTSRAKAVAEELQGDPCRIRGFLSEGHLNRKWTSIVCRFLRKGDIGKEEGFEDEGDKAKQRLRKCTSLLVGAWACKEVGPIAVEEAAVPKAGMVKNIDTGNQGDYVRCIVQLMCLTGIAARLNQCKVLRNEGRFSGHGLDDLRATDLNRLFKKDAEGWLAVCAAIHNREQHASNGNINFTLGDVNSPKVADTMIALAAGTKVYRHSVVRGDGMAAQDMAERIGRLPYVPVSNRTSRV